MEFRNSIETTGVNIPARMVDYIIAQAENGIVEKRVQRDAWQSSRATLSSARTAFQTLR
jgi:hypothetical protein